MPEHSHPQLRRWYIEFNRRWWNGELPNDVILVWKPVPQKWAGYTTRDASGRFTICIDPSIQGLPRYAKLVLLHEMIHVRHWKACHGKVFKAEQKRLEEAGAIRPLW